jgi:hypothetical protein
VPANGIQRVTHSVDCCDGQALHAADRIANKACYPQ